MIDICYLSLTSSTHRIYIQWHVEYLSVICLDDLNQYSVSLQLCFVCFHQTNFLLCSCALSSASCWMSEHLTLHPSQKQEIKTFRTSSLCDLQTHHVVVVDDHQLDVFGLGLDGGFANKPLGASQSSRNLLLLLCLVRPVVTCSALLPVITCTV